MVKNLPTMQMETSVETPVLSLGLDDHLEKEKATHSSILPGNIPWKRAWRATVQAAVRAGHNLAAKPLPI